MKAIQEKTGRGTLRIVYLWGAVSVVGLLICFGYHLYGLFQDWQRYKPQPQVERLIRDLRSYHTQTGHFPQNFAEINARLWHARPAPDYGAEGRQARTKNYYYLYTRVSEDKCAFWALPIGPKREYGVAFFVVIAPGWMRIWKGEALQDEVMARLPVIPSPEVLAEFKFQEVPGRVFSQVNGRSIF